MLGKLMRNMESVVEETPSIVGEVMEAMTTGEKIKKGLVCGAAIAVAGVATYYGVKAIFKGYDKMTKKDKNKDIEEVEIVEEA